MEINNQKIKELRDITGVGIIKCREALVKAEGDIEKAIQELRKSGEATAVKKAQRETSEGIIASYIHSNQKIGVLVKLACETDFVAKNEDFQELAKDIAMQVAATNPQFLDFNSIPEDILEKEKEIEKKTLSDSGKSKEIVAKIIEGKLDKFGAENSLLGQSYVKNPQITIKDLIEEKINKLGENIKVTEFVRFEL